MTQRKDQAASTDKKLSRLEIYLSAFLCPGSGQMVQKRWPAALFFSLSFLVCFALILIKSFRLWYGTMKAAGAFIEGKSGVAMPEPDIVDFVVLLASGLIVYILNLFDVTRAYRRRATQKNLDRFKRHSGNLPLLAVLMGLILIQQAPGAPIHWAVKNNNFQKVNRILDDRGTNALNSTMAESVTPLHIAAAMNNRELTGLLITRGADVSAKTDAGFTPLHWAAGRDAEITADMLITMGANVNTASTNRITPLHWAASRNATNVVKLLIDKGASLERETSEGLTALHWAVRRGAEEAASLLAYSSVSEELSRQTASGASSEPEDRDMEKAGRPQKIHRPKRLLPEPVPGKKLVVPIGFGEALEFVWVESLGLWLGRYEVTNGQYRRFAADHSSLFYGDLSLNGADQPVVYVTWQDATDFCSWLNENYYDRLPENFRFRLPYNREWETFARCGTQREYPWGNGFPPEYGNYSDRTARKHISPWDGLRRYEDGYAVTAPVTESGVNAWGIYGVGGNVWEWCLDWYGRSRDYKVRKGGSWAFDSRESLRVEYKGFDRPDVSYDTIGFRVLAAPKK